MAEQGVVVSVSLSIYFQTSSYLLCSAQVMDTLNKEGLSSLTFLDYLAYIPLFLGIHDTIVDNPLDTSKHR